MNMRQTQRPRAMDARPRHAHIYGILTREPWAAAGAVAPLLAPRNYIDSDNSDKSKHTTLIYVSHLRLVSYQAQGRRQVNAYRQICKIGDKAALQNPNFFAAARPFTLYNNRQAESVNPKSI